MIRNIFTLAILTLFFVACNSQVTSTVKLQPTSVIDKHQGAIDKFWKWFESNEKELRNFQRNPDKYLGQVLDSAENIEGGLAIEFEPPANNTINVTISADGNRDLFPVVQKIVESAPKINGWTFVAFRQRIPIEKVKGMNFEVKGTKLSPDNMKFYPIITGDTLDLIIYANNITEENYNQAAYSSLLLVDNILGEYDCVMKVRHFDLQNTPTKKEELKDLLPLLDLAEFVDNFQKTKRP
ncbi:hypothetical protein DVR12_12985 [Chitinophaga silvatica]|uniref:Uncharacterized protein n=1 Tax=Chitinophaga silvatica TaxID=2282649 RepID=A0A3E1YAJ6_9BACT|nr:hypothetical protein [Chitinophaga silvatica]RFS22702.1 hypothetical protein DVR12_12985 [Chitinophaga silvatica]